MFNPILSNASFPPYSFPLPHIFGACFSPSLHLVKNLTLLGENMGLGLDEEVEWESHLCEAGLGAGVL